MAKKKAPAISEDYLDTFPGAVVRFVLDELLKFDMAATAWQGLEETDRNERLEKMRDRAETLARTLVDHAAAQGHTAVLGEITGVNFKKDITISVKAQRGQNHIQALAVEAGHAVQVILSNDPLDLQAPPIQAEVES